MDKWVEKGQCMGKAINKASDSCHLGYTMKCYHGFIIWKDICSYKRSNCEANKDWKVIQDRG